MLLIPVLISLIFIEKGDVVLFLNGIHSPAADLFFKYMTHFGDGLLLIGFLVLSFFISKYHSVLIATIAVFQGVFTYILKMVIFKDMPRPAGFLNQEVLDGLQFVAGVNVHTAHSFPSGHTLTAFSFGVFICLLFPSRNMAIPALILAMLAAVSRVYLVQHFFMDIAFGSIVGVLISLGAHWLLGKLINKTYRETVLSVPLIKLRGL